jgi:hypothetical protein
VDNEKAKENAHGRKSGLGKNDIGSSSGSVGGSLDGDSDVGSGKGRGVVGSVTGHGADGRNKDRVSSSPSRKRRRGETKAYQR